jgi:hypothetical protein
MRKITAFAAATALLLAPVACVATDAKSRITGVFSDLRYVPDAGDVVGTEIFLIYGGGPYYVLIQCAEGRVGGPVLLPAIVDGANLSVTVPKDNDAGCPGGEMRAEISARGLNGKTGRLEWPGFLPRRKSYWQ